MKSKQTKQKDLENLKDLFDINHQDINHQDINHQDINHQDINHRSINHGSINYQNINHGSWKEECGIFGVWNDPEASKVLFLGLYAQQHRGQESAGIITLHEEKRHVIARGIGLVGDVFKESDLQRLKGKAGIGHVRYSTTGKNLLSNAQPLTARFKNFPMAMAHNGNLVNAEKLKNELQEDGAIFQGTNDSESVLHLVAKNKNKNLMESLIESIQCLEGAFSIVFMSDDALYAVRDPMGFRPLVLGKRKHDGGSSYVVASETCAFDLIGAEYIREVKPGELIKICDKGMESIVYNESKDLKRCVFEHVYFSRPDSNVFGKHVYTSRKKMGASLYKEFPIEADIVVPVPDSGIPAAIGYAEASGIPFELGIIRNHYVGRTFIQPGQSIRTSGVKIKLNPQRSIINGKKVILIDDSVVRGTTSKKVIDLVRKAGAKEVHLRVSSPPTVGPCYYGVDTPDKEQLIASRLSIKEICDYIKADSLEYLSHEGLVGSVSEKSDKSWGFCSACFTGNYPTKIYKN